LNEEAAIGAVVAAVPRAVVDEVIVVDGGSRDATVHVAEAAGARVVPEQRRGYGRACASGAAATSADVIVWLDGDGSDDASAIGQIVGPIWRGEADLVLGSRARVEASAMPFYARAGNTFAALVISLLWGQRITDLPSCKAIRRSDLVNLRMSEATYGWTTELIVKAARQGLRLKEVPLAYRPRVGGVSKVSGNPYASAKAAIAILRVLARHGFGRPDQGLAGQPALVE
jgi:glycosyltransferase involved in cell wall biosynthesis